MEEIEERKIMMMLGMEKSRDSGEKLVGSSHDDEEENGERSVKTRNNSRTTLNDMKMKLW